MLSEKWPDVHSVLLYQGGKLVFEERFYRLHVSVHINSVLQQSRL